MADRPTLVLVARCKGCGLVVAGHVICQASDRDDCDLGEIVREHAGRHAVEVIAVREPVMISRCRCAADAPSEPLRVAKEFNKMLGDW